ncbi:MAG: hypothetical protein QOI66_4193, partial [Myxococcales bacterium]|nr:hypothetical protein [Myxococcales bacterium]
MTTGSMRSFLVALTALSIASCGDQAAAPDPTGVSSAPLMLGAPGIPGRSDQFVRSGTVLYQRFTEGTRQHDYVALGNRGVALQSDPVAASWGTGRTDVFVINQNQTIEHGGLQPGADSFAWWDNWGTPVPGRTLVGLAVTSGRAGVLDIFVVDQAPYVGTNNLYHKRYDNGSDSGWQLLSGSGALNGPQYFRAPGAVGGGSNGSESFDVFVRGYNSATQRWNIYHLSSPNGGATVYNWENLGEPGGAALASEPSAASWSDGRMDVVVTDTAGAIRHIYTAGCGAHNLYYCTGYWWYWNNWGSPPVTSAAIVALGPNRLRVFGRDASNGSLWQVSWGEPDNTPRNFGGYFDGAAAVSSYGLEPCHTTLPSGTMSCDGDQVCDDGVCVHPQWPPSCIRRYDGNCTPLYSQQLADEPGNWAEDWTNDLQGQAHNDQWWYFTNEQSIIKIPLSADPARYGGHREDRGPTFYANKFHYGDPTYYRNVSPYVDPVGHDGLFVPIESDSGRFMSLHPSDLSTFWTVPMPYGNLAWAAINPLDGLLYVPKTFYNLTQIDAYKILWPAENNNQLQLIF